MLRMRTDDERIAAMLHDVVEDTDWTLDELRQEGFPELILHAVDCLTKREGRSYDDLIQRAASDPIARQVKLGDLEDNMDIRRHSEPLTQGDLDRFERYRRAWLKLSA
jgi:(p)ppGpp synthase/HD superfamily hydrolase